MLNPLADDSLLCPSPWASPSNCRYNPVTGTSHLRPHGLRKILFQPKQENNFLGRSRIGPVLFSIYGLIHSVLTQTRLGFTPNFLAILKQTPDEP